MYFVSSHVAPNNECLTTQENDLIRGSKRTSTVMTKNKVEMFCLHSEVSLLKKEGPKRNVLLGGDQYFLGKE